MPLAYGGRDEKALQSRRRTDQSAASRGARAETRNAPEAVGRSKSAHAREIRQSLDLPANWAKLGNSREPLLMCCVSSVPSLVNLGPCSRLFWRTLRASARRSLPTFYSTRAALFVLSLYTVRRVRGRRSRGVNRLCSRSEGRPALPCGCDEAVATRCGHQDGKILR